MSRKQWGHGYWKGIEDYRKGKIPTHKYICELNEDGLITNAYMVWGFDGKDTYVLENLRDDLCFINMSGILCRLSESPDDICYDMITTKSVSELSEFHEPKFLINQVAFLGFVNENNKLADKRYFEEHPEDMKLFRR